MSRSAATGTISLYLHLLHWYISCSLWALRLASAAYDQHMLLRANSAGGASRTAGWD